MPTNLDNLDPDSRKIIEQAMSMGNSARSMGLEATRQAEQQQLAEDMERKNAEARRRRGAMIAGEDPVIAQAKKQAPVRKRRPGAMAQQPSMVMDNIRPVPQMPPEPSEQREPVENDLKKAFSKIRNVPEPEVPEETPVEDMKPQVESKPVPSVHTVSLQVSNDTPDEERMVDDLDAFTRMRKLPSKGLFYENPVSGQSLKLIDNYYLDDIVDGLTDSRMAINAILARRVRGVVPDDILTCDESYILHWLRVASFPSHGLRHPGYICPHCHFNTAQDDLFRDFRIGFGNLKFTLNKDIDSLYELHRANGYHSGILGDGRECHVYVHRLRHATVLNNFVSDWEDKNQISMPAAMRKVVGIATVVEIEGCDAETEEDRMKQKVQYISEIPVRVKKDLEQLVVEGTVACNISASITCGRCGGLVETPYPFLVRWFVSGL